MLTSSTSAMGFLSQGYDGQENSNLLATGQLYTEAWDEKWKLANEKKLQAQTYQMYARAGIIATVALAVFMTFASGLLAGVTMGICALIPYVAWRKARADEWHHMEPVRQERFILGNIYDTMAKYFVSCQEERQKPSPFRRLTRSSSGEEEEHVQLAKKIQNMVNPIEFAEEDYRTYRIQEGSCIWERRQSPWEHLLAVCDITVESAAAKARH